MITAYERFYERAGVPILTVEADTGMMGGGVSHEFMLVAEQGEDTLIRCPGCAYAANREVAVAAALPTPPGTSPEWTFWMGSDGQRIAVGIPPRGAVSGIKVARAVGVLDAREAEPDERPDRHAGAWGTDVRLVVDVRLGDMGPQIVSPIRADINAVQAGAPCARCGTPLEAVRGIEVGNTFQLGTYYTVPMEAGFTTREGHR